MFEPHRALAIGGEALENLGLKTSGFEPRNSTGLGEAAQYFEGAYKVLCVPGFRVKVVTT